MGKDKTPETDLELRGFFGFALRLWKDGAQLQRIRETLAISKADFAARAGISVQKLNAYERPGPVAGNFWLFCHDLRKVFIDPRLWNDPDYVDEFLEPDEDDQLKGGKESDRDNWFEWSGDKFKKFRRWAHRKYIEKLPDAERRKPRSKRQIKKWYDEWDRLGRPDANEIIEPIE